MDKMKVGFIGTGVIFDLNILGYLNNPDVDITCLCDSKVDKAKAKITKFDLEEDIRIYSDYKEMLDKEELDIVEILLPHFLHAEVTIYAAQKGIKGISVQKPMALTLEEADKMIEECNKSGSILSIYENFLFAPHIIKAKELLERDYIGNPISFGIKTIMGMKGGWNIPESALEWRRDPEKIGGAKKGSPVLLDNGWHAFSLAYWFFNKEIEKVFAWVDEYNGNDIPAYVIFKYKQNSNGKIAQYGNMEFNLLPEIDYSESKYYAVDEFIEINGSRGIMKINQSTSAGNYMSRSDVFPPLVVIRDKKVEVYRNFELDWKNSFINATHDFIDKVKNNEEPMLSAEKAKYILKFNLAAIKSAEIGKKLSIDQKL